MGWSDCGVVLVLFFRRDSVFLYSDESQAGKQRVVGNRFSPEFIFCSAVIRSGVWVQQERSIPAIVEQELHEVELHSTA